MDLAKRIVAKAVGLCVALIGIWLMFAAFGIIKSAFTGAPVLTYLGGGILLVVTGIGLMVGGQWVGNYFDDKPPPTPPE